MDKLAHYKLDKAFTSGVVINLDHAPEVDFLVKLPSQYNREYCQALYGAMQWEAGADGEVKTGGALMATRYAQEDAFVAHCLLSKDGEPIPESFSEEYPEAVAELMTKADKKAVEIAKQVEDAAKK